MKERVYFSLGSNIGDRKTLIYKALDNMDKAFATHWKRLSSIIETKSWGFEGPDFLNCAVMYELDADPLEILGVCQDIEKRMGRENKGIEMMEGRRIFHNRPIDIDILLYGDRRMESEELTIPHPLMEKRDFVMQPLREIYE